MVVVKNSHSAEDYRVVASCFAGWDKAIQLNTVSLASDLGTDILALTVDERMLAGLLLTLQAREAADQQEMNQNCLGAVRLAVGC